MAIQDELGFIGKIAVNIGSSENALRLLLSLLAGYPLAYIHRQFLFKRSPNLQHIFFILCGLSLCYFNFGTNAIHSIINILVVYGVLRICGGTGISVILILIINMTYLVTGYYTNMSKVYTVKWTTPHCVLTLRLIGLAYDIYDGQQPSKALSSSQGKTALKKMPSFLEIAGHVYFFGSFLVGPQFPMRRYLDFVTGANFQNSTSLPNCVKPALLRLAAGLSYTAVYQLSVIILPDSYLLSEGFSELNLLFKIFVITIWGKVMLYKYVACWLITEGACTLTGLTYNNKDDKGNDMWDSCANIKIRIFEPACTAQNTIKAFNVNTNNWMSEYVFKRLKFMGSKNISFMCTLFFLALWHGLYSGYYMNFSMEFFIIKFERDFESFMKPFKLTRTLQNSTILKPFVWLLMKFYLQFSLSYALVSFCLFTYDQWGWVYLQVYCIGHIYFLTPFIFPVLKSLLHPKKEKSTKLEKTE